VLAAVARDARGAEHGPHDARRERGHARLRRVGEHEVDVLGHEVGHEAGRPAVAARGVGDHALERDAGAHGDAVAGRVREHLVGRGLIKEGFFADITIFDPDNIIDKATYTQPAQLAEGVKYVIVNGQVAFENGKATGAMAGKALKGQGVK